MRRCCDECIHFTSNGQQYGICKDLTNWQLKIISHLKRYFQHLGVLSGLGLPKRCRNSFSHSFWLLATSLLACVTPSICESTARNQVALHSQYIEVVATVPSGQM